MRPSQTYTKPQKETLLKKITEKLISLNNHPELKELLKKIKISEREEEEIIKTYPALLSRAPRWAGNFSILWLSTQGLEETIIKRINYKYTFGGGDLIPYKTGGQITEYQKIISNRDQISELGEKYDLGIDVLEKIEQNIAHP